MANAVLKAVVTSTKLRLSCSCHARVGTASLSSCSLVARRPLHARNVCPSRERPPLGRNLSWSRADQAFLATASSQQDEVAAKSGGRLILLDAFALLFRAHFGLKDARMTTKSGEDTSILFAFIRTLLDLLAINPAPTHFAVVFDAAGMTFSEAATASCKKSLHEEYVDESDYVPAAPTARPARLEHMSLRHELFAGYKGQRPPTPQPISDALKQLRDLLRVMAIPEIVVPGLEADDVIGTLCNRALHQGFEVAIASPDKDFFQLLQPGIQLLRPLKKGYEGPVLGGMIPYTTESFQKEWDLQPAQFADLLALAGDSADNIPGVRGIGPKRAQALVRSHGTLEGVLENAHTEKAKATKAALTSQEGVQAARLSKKLVTIQTDVQLPPLQFPFSQLALQPPSDTTRAAVKAAFDTLEFKQHERRLDRIWEKMSNNQSASDNGQGARWGAANQTAVPSADGDQPVSPLEQPATGLK